MSTRRDLLVMMGGTLAGAVPTVGSLLYGLDRGQALAYKPLRSAVSGSDVATACTAGKLTLVGPEGPFYIPHTPRRRDIRGPSAPIDLVALTGRVLDSNCRPIAGAVLDFWQTGDKGEYDLQGYGYRGHQYTDADGRYTLLTIRPSEYTSLGLARTPHIHVKVQGAGTGLLATQLFFPDANETNSSDPIFDPDLVVRLDGKQDNTQLASFDFVLART